MLTKHDFILRGSFCEKYNSQTQVHLFGAGLGGYLAQKFAELTFRSPMVRSLVLCNTFSDTTDIAKVSDTLFLFLN